MVSSSQRNVSNWENGASEPDLETIVRLREIFQVSFEELFGLEPPPSGGLRAEETEFLARLRRLDKRQRMALAEFLDAFDAAR